MTVGAELIAPCGMNCQICLGYLRERNRCLGCRADDVHKRASCVKCSIVNCEFLHSTQSGFCYDCPKYPCRRLSELDKRYRTNYSMSMIENLEFIREHGLTAFAEKEEQRWRCQECGNVISVHRSFCLKCGKSRADSTM